MVADWGAKPRGGFYVPPHASTCSLLLLLRLLLLLLSGAGGQSGMLRATRLSVLPSNVQTTSCSPADCTALFVSAPPLCAQLLQHLAESGAGRHCTAVRRQRVLPLLKCQLLKQTCDANPNGLLLVQGRTAHSLLLAVEPPSPMAVELPAAAQGAGLHYCPTAHSQFPSVRQSVAGKCVSSSLPHI